MNPINQLFYVLCTWHKRKIRIVNLRECFILLLLLVLLPSDKDLNLTEVFCSSGLELENTRAGSFVANSMPGLGTRLCSPDEEGVFNANSMPGLGTRLCSPDEEGVFNGASFSSVLTDSLPLCETESSGSMINESSNLLGWGAPSETARRGVVHSRLSPTSSPDDSTIL